MTCRENGSTLETVISVQGTEREKLGQPTDSEVLSEIAKITRGKMVTTADFKEVLEKISELPEPEPRLKRIRIWSHWIWASSLILLLTIFWVGRKLAGKI